MATNQVTPGQEVTGRESVDNAAAIEAQINQKLDLIQKQLTQQTGAQNPNAVNVDQNTAPGPVKFNIHGKEFQFANQEEASRAIEEALSQTRELTAAQLAQQTQQTQQTQKVDPTGGFDRKHFADLIEQDPSKGLNYALGQLIFGADVPDAGGVIRQQFQELAKLKQMSAVSTFRNTVKDFAGTPEEIQAVESMRQQMNLPTDNPMAWETAFAMAKHRGLIKPDVQQQQQTQQNSGPFLPPMSQRETGAPAAAWVQRAEQLPTAELERFINEMQGGR